MSFNLSEKLKNLRKEKNISQEKLANYLNISFQAVSKWENGITYPDIVLLPDIARFFGITIDDLLQVEKLNEVVLYKEYEANAEKLFRDGKNEDVLKIWLEAYKKMPNNVEVKEMLMSIYYDIDKIKYFNEIVELGVDIYNGDVPMYYKGQAIREIANTYAESCKLDLAEKWATKSISLFNSQEILFTQIYDNDEKIHHVSWCMYWFLHEIYYMASGIVYSDNITKDIKYKQNLFKTVSKIYEDVYINDDMSFESLKLLYLMHAKIAQMENQTTNEEDIVKLHINRAYECVYKSINIKEHTLTHPMLDTWKIQSSPDNNKQLVILLKNFITIKEFDEYRDKEWFIRVVDKLNKLVID